MMSKAGERAEQSAKDQAVANAGVPWFIIGHMDVACHRLECKVAMLEKQLGERDDNVPLSIEPDDYPAIS